ncbi:unnamed protein product [Effrenium voratum]|nr:unnamed protein product [Effrenium voratum]
MAAKRNGQKDAKAKASAKGKAAAAKAAPATLKSVKKEPDSREKASSGPSVDKAAQQEFINSIKYRANTKNDPDAQTLLEAYNKMSSTEKKALISRFQAQGGLKNLSWAAKLKQEAIDSTTVTSNTEKGMFTASQILKFHGLVVGVNITQERQDVVLKELLRENREELGLDPNINIDQVHPTIPELSRYYYEKASSSTSTSNQVQTTLEVGSSSVKTDSLLKPMIAHGDESTGVHENPGYAALLETMKALQSVKGKVDKELSLARSLLLANETVALLLPHELLHVLGTMNSAETLTQLDGAVESVQSMLDSDIPFELGIKDAMHFLQLSYDCLHKVPFVLFLNPAKPQAAAAFSTNDLSATMQVKCTEPSFAPRMQLSFQVEGQQVHAVQAPDRCARAENAHGFAG